MATLLLRLSGPMQSWGTQSRFGVRDTGLEPSKSGVIGLLSAALGRPRAATVEDLAALRMGVRVDWEGALRADYQTAGGAHRRGESYGVYKADGSRAEAVTSTRYYLADADFLVGLEGEEHLLSELQRALASPIWQLFLGRKAFVPGLPVQIPDGLRPLELWQAILSLPWPNPFGAVGKRSPTPDQLRVVLEVDPGAGDEVRRDQPVGAAFAHRRFALRNVTTRLVKLGEEVPLLEDAHVSVAPTS